MIKFLEKMTNRKRHFALWITAISVFTAVSCIEIDKSLGSDLLPSDYDLTLKTMELNLPIEMKMADSLQTIYSGTLIFGSYKDPIFGEVSSATAFTLVPSVTDNDFGDNPVVKYLKMYIAVSSKSYINDAEASIPQNVYIYRLLNDLDTLKPFNCSYSLADVDPIPINENTVYLGGDSIVCNIKTAYANELLSATQEERDSTDIFIKRFKGYYISTNPLPGSLTGGRFNLISASDVYMLINYRHTSTEDDIDKDSVISYYTDTERPYLNTFKHSSQNLATALPTQKLYVEGLAGIKPYLDFTKVKQNFDDWAETQNIDLKKVVISKAEIVLPYEFPADYTTMNQYPSTLFLSTRVLDTLTNLRYYQPISDMYIDGSDGAINRVNYEYRMNVTTYIQKLLNETHDDSYYLKAWIFPVYSQTNSYTSSTSYFVESSAYYRGILNGNLAARAPKLIMTYSVLK